MKTVSYIDMKPNSFECDMSIMGYHGTILIVCTLFSYYDNKRHIIIFSRQNLLVCWKLRKKGYKKESLLFE